MIRPHLPLNSLRSFEAAARHLSFTHAAAELRVTPAALSHQVKSLEERLGLLLFRRLPRGLSLTDEGAAMLPVLRDCFDRMAILFEQLEEKSPREPVTVGVVGTFAVSWLLPRVDRFHQENPSVDLRLSTHNNRVDLAEEGLDFAIRFGDGAWNATHADLLFEAPFTPLCSPGLAATLNEPADLLGKRLLRSYRVADWQVWFEAAGIPTPLIRGIMFDSARLMVDAAIAGHGVALAPPRMFEEELVAGVLRAPFELAVGLGAYWLTRLKSRELSRGMSLFRTWLLAQGAASALAQGQEDSSH